MKILMLCVLAVLVVLLAVALINRHRNASSPLNLEDLLLGDDGRLSKAAAVLLGSFAMTTWVIVYLTVNDKLTEGYFIAYLGVWVAPTVTRLIGARPPTELTTATPPPPARTAGASL